MAYLSWWTTRNMTREAAIRPNTTTYRMGKVRIRISVNWQNRKLRSVKTLPSGWALLDISLNYAIDAYVLGYNVKQFGPFR